MPTTQAEGGSVAIRSLGSACHTRSKGEYEDLESAVVGRCLGTQGAEVSCLPANVS